MKLSELRTAEGTLLPENTRAELRRDMTRLWLAECISRSTWYRRHKRARDAAAVAFACATFERAEAFAAALTLDLARCAALERETMVILAELAAFAAAGRQAMV
jgi:hypothetical protein